MEQTLIAPAKVNLFLHLIGQNTAGYHRLESLFSFTNFGDVINFKKADSWGFQCVGPFSKTLTELGAAGDDNLCMKMARSFYGFVSKNSQVEAYPVEIRLEKNLPIAAGIGGGSSDAAAALVALNTLWQVGLTLEELAKFSLKLGADIPACVHQTPCFVEGVGDIITPLTGLKDQHIVLANPLSSLSTPLAFKAFHTLRGKFHSSLMGGWVDDYRSSPKEFLQRQSNDLDAAACHLVPEIGPLLHDISELSGCWLSRMSGSGATCFGLFDGADQATEAVSELQRKYPTYWMQKGILHG